MEHIRLLYNDGHKSKEQITALLEALQTPANPVEEAYAAAAKMISTKFMMNPFQRIKPFQDGKMELEELISENFDEVEMRYLRYTIQMNIPKILGYYKNKEEDRRILLNYIHSHPGDALTEHILFYLRDTKDMEGVE